MSSDVIAPAPAAALSPHTLASALNAAAGARAPLAADELVAPLVPALAPLPEPGVDDEVEEPVAGLLMFRVGAELFAVALADVEEAIELEATTPLPEMPAHMLGVLRLRGATLPLYSPAAALGVRAGEPLAALVVRDGARRIALAIDDVDDVLELRDRDLRPTPDATDDRVLLGIAHRGADLVSAVDLRALVAACVVSEPEAA